MTTKQKLIERIKKTVEKSGCSIMPVHFPLEQLEKIDKCYDAIAQAWLEDLEKARANENQECQKIVQSLFSTREQLGQMRARLIRAEDTQTNE